MAEEFHLSVGGPFYRLGRAVHLSLRGAIIAAIGIAWVPLAGMSLAEWVASGKVEPLIRDLSVHLRFLVAAPLFLVGERLLDYSCRTTVEQLFAQELVPRSHERRVRTMLLQVVHWRDSRWPELVILAGALCIGGLTWAGLIHQPAVRHFEPHGVVGGWYTLIALPMFQFLMWRSLFLWALWARVLGGLSRVPLELRVAHADRHGGLSFLKRPSLGYGVVLLLALSSVLSGGWASEVLHHGAKLSTFKPLLLVYVCVGLTIALGPLLTFIPRLFVARAQGRRQYEGLVTEYARRFDERWLSGQSRSGLLGSSDIQSLADLGNVYRDNIEQMKILIFDPRDLALLVIASLLPMVPVMLLQIPAQQLLRQLLQLVTGGLPV
jgi:hypothetical protein